MGGILAKIWALPWYKVFVIAVADDIILFLKMWWLWAGIILLIAIYIAYWEWTRRRK